MWRYEYIWRNGGLYMDVDDVLVRPFAIPSGLDALYMYDRRHRAMYNGFYWALPGDESLRRCAQFMKHNSTPENDFHYNIRFFKDVLGQRIGTPLDGLDMSTPYEVFTDAHGKRIGILKWRSAGSPSCLANGRGEIFLHVHGAPGRERKQDCRPINRTHPW